MAYERLITPARATDENGIPISGARWYFYTTETLTPRNVYADADLTTPLTNPVVADSGGWFPDIYFDNDFVYRGVLKNSDDSVTIEDTDPINQGVYGGGGGGSGTVVTIVAGDGIDIDDSDPANPIISVEEGAGGAMVYPDVGIPVSTGTAWAASKVAPVGTIVGTTDAQELRNKLLNSPTLPLAPAFPYSLGSSGGRLQWNDEADETHTVVISIDGGILTDNQIDISNDGPNTAAALGFRGYPVETAVVDTTIDLSLSGKLLAMELTGKTVTLPPNASVSLPIGFHMKLVSAGNFTTALAPGGGVSLYLSGSNTSGSVTIPIRAAASITKTATDVWTVEIDGVTTGDISVPDDPYDATTWNGNLEVPTKNAIRDKIESLIGSNPTENIIIACSDETTAITTGTAKRTFRMPYAFTLTAVRASVTTAPTGSTIIIDINEAGGSILSTKLSIDVSEKTSTTAASAAVISDGALADDAEITIDFDQVGSTIAGAGVKVYFIGSRT